MSSTTLASDHELQPTDILVPLDIDKDRLHWDGNPAHIKGILHAIGQYWERMGLFQPFIKDRAVLLSNGKMAVDSIQAVKFERVLGGSDRARAYHRGHEHGNYQAKRRSAPASPLKVVTLGDWATLRVLDRRRGAHSGTQQRIEAELDRRQCQRC